jgi:aspartyl/asparaginyl beta-hydroxylase (cupin superfamily)
MNIKKWYSFDNNTPYKGSEPSFFDISDKAWSQRIKNNYTVILSELQTVINSQGNNIIPYFNQTLADKAENWNILPLYVWGKKNEQNCKSCPATTAVIESIPGMTSCSFSILKPHSSIRPHHGDSNVMYRCHFTLKCEHSLSEIGMRVRNESVSWENKKIFAFCDAYEHEVWNRTDEERWILIIDVLREEFVSQQKQICNEINATLFWQLKFQNFYFIKHLPAWNRKLLMKLTSYFM